MIKRRIGAFAEVAIPEWGLRKIRAKIDTGAFTSSLDVEEVLVLPPDDRGRQRALITLLDGKVERQIEARVLRFRKVRNPSGSVTNRPLVQVELVLGGRRFKTPVNLHRRDGMSCRMIVGRRALAGRFVVDVELGREKNRGKTVRRS